MIKRAQGRNRFGMKNFKKRWFRLTNHEFTYHKTKGEGNLLQSFAANINFFFNQFIKFKYK